MKQAIRDREKEKRDSLSRTQLGEKSKKIMGRLFSLLEFQAAEKIAFYVSTGSEVNTRAIIKKSLSMKKRVFVPVVRKEKNIIEFSEISSLGDLEKGAFGILEPKKKLEKLCQAEKMDIVVVPGIAFDRHGHRVGYGKGYYDRLGKKLAEKTKTIGLCFEENLVERIPADKNDRKVKIVLTDKETVFCD